MYAVFPLSIVVLPEESVALHLFEPRYRQLYQDYKDGKPFVILYSGKDGHSKVGSLVFINETIKEFPDGTIDVVVKGIKPIQIINFLELYPNKLYSAVQGELLNLYDEPNDAVIEQAVLYFNSVKKKINTNQIISTYSIANMLCLEEEKKQEILGSKSEAEVNTFLLNELKLLAKMYSQEMNLNERFFLN